MKMMDCVEVLVEKETYAKEGVHKGMQGWICLEQRVEGYWLVDFPQYGEKDDIAMISIREEDLMMLPHGMDTRVNERIKAQFDAIEQADKAEKDSDTGSLSENISDYLI